MCHWTVEHTYNFDKDQREEKMSIKREKLGIRSVFLSEPIDLQVFLEALL